MNMGDITGRIVALAKVRGIDLDSFHDDVLALAHDTARSLAVTLDQDVTAQLKAALQFLYGLADGVSTAHDAGEGDAKPEPADGYPMDL